MIKRKVSTNIQSKKSARKAKFKTQSLPKLFLRLRSATNPHPFCEVRENSIKIHDKTANFVKIYSEASFFEFEQILLPLLEVTYKGEISLLLVCGPPGTGRSSTILGHPQDPGLLFKILKTFCNEQAPFTVRHYSVYQDYICDLLKKGQNAHNLSSTGDAMTQICIKSLREAIEFHAQAKQKPAQRAHNIYYFSLADKGTLVLVDLIGMGNKTAKTQSSITEALSEVFSVVNNRAKDSFSLIAKILQQYVNGAISIICNLNLSIGHFEDTKQSIGMLESLCSNMKPLREVIEESKHYDKDCCRLNKSSDDQEIAQQAQKMCIEEEKKVKFDSNFACEPAKVDQSCSPIANKLMIQKCQSQKIGRIRQNQICPIESFSIKSIIKSKQENFIQQVGSVSIGACTVQNMKKRRQRKAKPSGVNNEQVEKRLSSMVNSPVARRTRKAKIKKTTDQSFDF